MTQRLWRRHRFFQPTDDYRPIKFPPPGPYWCTGYRGSDDAAVIVAYLPPEIKVTDWWPEAIEEEGYQERAEIVYTDRFAKPEWYHGPTRLEATTDTEGGHGNS